MPPWLTIASWSQVQDSMLLLLRALKFVVAHFLVSIHHHSLDEKALKCFKKA